MVWQQNDYNESLDVEGFEFVIDSMPKLWYLSPMIIADDANEIVDLYGDDYTFGMMSARIDSYFDDDAIVYCSFVVTAHDYSGQQMHKDNATKTVKREQSNFVLNAGESKECKF